ncbi:MAG TPA: methyltransferase domain-containing protein [Deltaproteobacteria bacterium]|nr:methyltransferase domain-containing protein [Deltaproteobacteria bacterium]HPR54191.1 methyltransferase domain-containing protein [Deltaproteobacteria bacterium]HXK45898.1 methyltransferase domain-containing protein [Deltaproteobacteria bacterium]
MHGYVHGYSEREAERLSDQAETLEDLLHSDTRFPPRSRVLEVGCGTGAQTLILGRNSPEARIVAIDISRESLAEAKTMAVRRGMTNVEFRAADVYSLPFDRGSFHHIFICFVLEHLKSPLDVLKTLKEFLLPGGTITLIEGDHGSAYFYPDSDDAERAIRSQIEIQKRSGGNALIGRELYPLLVRAGFEQVRVSPRMVYVDASRPGLVEGFTKNTFIAMIEGIRDKVLQLGLMEQVVFDKGVQDLYRTAGEEGVFCYTFFKACGVAS